MCASDVAEKSRKKVSLTKRRALGWERVADTQNWEVTGSGKREGGEEVLQLRKRLEDQRMQPPHFTSEETEAERGGL